MGFFTCLLVDFSKTPNNKNNKTNTLKKRNPFKLHFTILFSMFNGFLAYKNHEIPAANARHNGTNQSEYSVLILNNVFLN